MLAMLIVCVIFLKKNNISVSNVDALTAYLTGGTLTVALIIIGFSIVKNFALIFPPAVLFVLSGIVFDNMLTAAHKLKAGSYKSVSRKIVFFLLISIFCNFKKLFSPEKCLFLIGFYTVTVGIHVYQL